MNCLKARFKRSVPSSQAYADRLSQEMLLIESKGFGPYFHKVLDVLELVTDIPHITRGSSGSSLVCYLLGITDIDPIEHNIDVSRFMHQFREDEPDIDIDFPHYLQSLAHQRVYDKWPTLAYRISNNIHYRKRSSIKEARRRLGKGGSDSEVQALSSEIKGTRKGISRHCGGVVIFDSPPSSDIVVGPNQISLDKYDVERLHLMKIDLLSNRGLSQLMDISGKSMTEYPEYDEATSSMLSIGGSLGVTQAESPAFRKLLKALKPKNRDDVIVAMGLIRPAAASRGKKAEFLSDWHSGNKGGLIFEDDSTFLISQLAGIPMDQADMYRRAFAKGKVDKIKEFTKLVPDDPKLIEDLSRFREYSLCKAHGISYGRMVWALAYQKANNPKDFWFSTLRHCDSMYRKWVHVQEAKKAGLSIVAGPSLPVRTGDVISMRDQPTLLPLSGWEEYKKYGFWSSNRFMPNCGYVDKNGIVSLTGLIATSRRLNKEDGSSVTFLTVGTDYDNLWDIVIDSLVNCDKMDIIEVKGEIKSLNGSIWIQAFEFKLRCIYGQ